MLKEIVVMSGVLLLSHVLTFAAPGDNPVARENKYVQVDVTLESNTVIAGTEGAILFAFTPVEGIHINADPPVEVAIEKNPEVTLQGDPDISTDKETGFLSTSSPVRQRFSVSSTATPGTYSLKGTIVYYFCSDTQGWCTKFRQRVTLKLIVARR